MDHFPMLVAQHLKLDVPRMLQEFFSVYVGCAKGLLRLATVRLVGSEKLILLADHTHAATTSARRGIENQRIPEVRSLLREVLLPFNDALASRHGAQTRSFHVPPSAVLFTPPVDALQA